MKRILGLTGIRSDYDLLSGLYRRLAKDSRVDLRLLVDGAHLSARFGSSVDLIRRDGIPILHSIESLNDSDSVSSRIRSASIALQGFIDPVSAWSPDAIIFAGDREEVIVGALLGTYLEIPTVHFYAGDHTTTGHIDNPVRHATSKLSSVHMVAIEQHRQRLIAMGEDPRRIHVVGNLSLDNIRELSAMSKAALREILGLPKAMIDYALVQFHPDPLERGSAGEYMSNIVEAVLASGLGVCMGYPNSDPANSAITDVILRYKDDDRCFIYKNLERTQFLSLYRHADFVIGNSSSGIIEAASFGLPSISVGIRQVGRYAGKNVVFCGPTRDEIDRAIHTVNEAAFRSEAANMVNPYGDGRAVERSAQILLDTPFPDFRLKTEDPLDIARLALAARRSPS